MKIGYKIKIFLENAYMIFSWVNDIYAHTHNFLGKNFGFVFLIFLLLNKLIIIWFFFLKTNSHVKNLLKEHYLLDKQPFIL